MLGNIFRKPQSGEKFSLYQAGSLGPYHGPGPEASPASWMIWPCTDGNYVILQLLYCQNARKLPHFVIPAKVVYTVLVLRYQHVDVLCAPSSPIKCINSKHCLLWPSTLQA